MLDCLVLSQLKCVHFISLTQRRLWSTLSAPAKVDACSMCKAHASTCNNELKKKKKIEREFCRTQAGPEASLQNLGNVFYLILTYFHSPLLFRNTNKEHIPENQNSVSFLWLWCLCASYPSAHEAIVEGQAYELEGGLLDEVGIEDSHLSRLPRNITSHRLPKPLRTPLTCRRGRGQQHKGGKGKCKLVVVKIYLIYTEVFFTVRQRTAIYKPNIKVRLSHFFWHRTRKPDPYQHWLRKWLWGFNGWSQGGGVAGHQ